MSIPADKLVQLQEDLQADFDKKEPPVIQVSGGLQFNEKTKKLDGAEVDIQVDFK